jgi:acetoin utilization deacetylase AcuC-like enzyme
MDVGSEEGAKEIETIFFGSTHEKDNYPGTGGDPTPYIGELAQKPIHRRIVNRYLSSGPKSREEFKTKWRQIVDEMILFQPKLIFISAGFDAHKDDPLSGTELTAEDFAWATQIVVDASRTLGGDSPIPIISTLEGGYNLKAITISAQAHVGVLSAANDYKIEEEASPAPTVGDEVAALTDHIKSLGLLETDK